MDQPLVPRSDLGPLFTMDPAPDLIYAGSGSTLEPGPGGSPNKNRQVEHQVQCQVKHQLDLQLDLLPDVLPDVLLDVPPDNFYLETLQYVPTPVRIRFRIWILLGW